MTKKFKNHFEVNGSEKSLLAFAEYAESIGWEQQPNMPEMYYGALYFNATRDNSRWPSTLQKGCFWNSRPAGGNEDSYTVYHLPLQWREAMKAAEEVVEEPKPEFKVGERYCAEDLGLIVVCLGEGNGDDMFFGMVLVPGKTGHPRWYKSKIWTKEAFTLHTDPVTI